MTEQAVSLSEAKARLSALINRVAYSRERVILTSHGRPKAALIGLDDLQALQSGPQVSALTAARLESLRRIVRHSSGKGRSRRKTESALTTLTAIRNARVAELGRLR